MKLEPQIHNQLSAALQDAFRDHEEFGTVLRKLGTNISQIASPNLKLHSVIDKTIEEMESEDRIHELLVFARETNPNNILLSEFTTRFLPISSLISDIQIRTVVPKTNVDPASWRQKLEMIERQVCHIEIRLQNDPKKSIGGTGFLVGPDLVLTNYHVVECLFNGEKENVQLQDWAKPEDVIIRFDYMLLPGERFIRKGLECSLKKGEWHTDWSPYSQADKLPEYPKHPTEDEMDYVFLKLDREVGNEPSYNIPGAPPRCWIELPQKSISYEQNQPIIIIHYPKGSCLKMAHGKNNRFIRLNENKTRMVYEASTEPGSSGAPCFDIYLNLIGVHRAGSDYLPSDHKEGIPISALVNLHNKKNKPPPEYQNELVTHQIETSSILVQLEQIFGYNWMFVVLHTNVINQASQQNIARLGEWLKSVQSFAPNEASQYEWQLLCVDKQIQLIGISDMTNRLFSSFSELNPLTEQDAPRFFRYAAGYVVGRVESISVWLEILTKKHNLSKYANTLYQTVTEIEEFEKELAAIRQMLKMYNCLVNENGVHLPQDKIDYCLNELRTEMKNSISKLKPDGAPLALRSNTSTRLKQLKEQSPEYRTWLYEMADKIEKTRRNLFSLN